MQHRGLFRIRASWCALWWLALAGCNTGGDESEATDAPNDSGADPDYDGEQPFRDVWVEAYSGDFAAFDEAGEPRIFTLKVGTPDASGDNFRNRGDVIVAYTGEPGKIRIELRKFTYTRQESAAITVFSRMELWAYNTMTATPSIHREDWNPDADCRADGKGWLDDCAIYVYYDGSVQTERAGADIRVTLPPEYRQRLEIVTSDNVIEDTYPNRGNVCIDNLVGSATVTMQSGLALVRLAEDLSPAPACPPESIADCTDVGDPSTIAGMEGLWSKNCACAQSLAMGALTVTADEADVIVDAPKSLWASVTAENQAGDGPDVCPVSVTAFGDRLEYDPMQTDDSEPWRLVGDANKPSDAALARGGYALKLTSVRCGPVAAVESPQEWDPDVDDPEPVTRGVLEICDDCLAEDPCAELPGG